MMARLPECAWDAEHGLIVLYRWEDDNETDPEPEIPFVLAIELAGGLTPYYAGEFPAERPIWAVKAPTEGAFRLLFFRLGDPGLLDTPPIGAIPFDHGLRVEQDVPAGIQFRLAGWRLLSTQDLDGHHELEIHRLEVPRGSRLPEAMKEAQWKVGDGAGMAVARYQGNGPEAPRGPSVHPFQHLGQEIDVHFTVTPSPRYLPEDAVQLNDFRDEDLERPTIVVDLTPFGDLAETLREGFCFLHRPHGPDGDFSHVYGANLPLQNTDRGRKVLIWACDEGCHLDLIGVFFSGGSALRPQADPYADVQISNQAACVDTDCLIGLFYGDDYRMLPTHAADYAARLRRDGALIMEMTELEVQRNVAWATADGRLGDGDWTGAKDAEAFTLALYADLLGLLSERTAQEGETLPGASPPVLGLRAFAQVRQRPDLACALLAEPRLASLLHQHRLRAEELVDGGPWSPVTVLAAVLEPDEQDLPQWIEHEPASVQRALWLFLLAGGRASVWRDLALPVAAANGDLDQLVKQLDWAGNEAFLGFAASVLDDVGQDTAALTRDPASLADIRARLSAMKRATALLNDELVQTNRALSGSIPGRQLDRRQLPVAFASALAKSDIPTAQELRQQVQLRCIDLGGGATLTASVSGLRTRAALWGLVNLLPLPDATRTSRDLRTAGPVRPSVDTDETLSGDVADRSAPPTSAREDAPTPAQDADALREPESAWPPEESSVCRPGPEPTQTPPPGGIRTEERDAPPGPDQFVEDPGAVGGDQSPFARDEDASLALADSRNPVRVLLSWCLRAVQFEGFDLIPQELEGETADWASVDSGLYDVEHFWGLVPESEPVALPSWSGARATEAQHIRRALERGSKLARRHLSSQEYREKDTPTDPAGLIRRLDSAREYIAAETVWNRVSIRANALRREIPGEDMRQLWTDIKRGAPDQWEALAARLDLLEVGAPVETA